MRMTAIGHDIAVVLTYFIVGAAIKYVDQAFDIRVFNKKIATVTAALTAILIAAMMVFDPPSAAIFLAISLGVAIAHKIDNIAFYIGLGLVILIPIIFTNLTHMPWTEFGILLAAAVADEFGNNWADKNLRNRKRQINAAKEAMIFLFRYRSAMKLAMFVIVVSQHMPFIYFPAFLLFDTGYIIMEKISWILKPYHLKNPTTLERAKKKPYRETRTALVKRVEDDPEQPRINPLYQFQNEI
jgi:hypothetical protein